MVGFLPDSHRVVSFSDDFNLVRNSFVANAGAGFYPTGRETFLTQAYRFSDGGLGFPDCSGVPSYPIQSFLAELTEDGGCVRLVDVNGPNQRLGNFFFPATRAPVYYAQGSLNSPNPSLAMSRRNDGLTEAWSSLTTTENGPSGDPFRTIKVLELRAWSSNKLLGAFQQGIQPNNSTRYTNQNGIEVVCPPATNNGNAVLAVHDATTGDLLWMHCLAGGTSSPAGFAASAIEPLGDGVLVALYVTSSVPGLVPLVIGSRTMMVNAGSSLLMYLTPPR